jgi:hypothetical protein
MQNQWHQAKLIDQIGKKPDYDEPGGIQKKEMRPEYLCTCNYSRPSWIIGVCAPMFDGSIPPENMAIVFGKLAVPR